MKRFIVLLIGVMIGAAGVVGGYFYFSARTAGHDFVTLVFTEKEIQEKIGRKFPKEKEVFNIIKIVIEEPEVSFMGENNRLQLSLKAKVIVPYLRTDDIRGVFSSSLRYERDDHTLRTSDYRVESLKTEVLPKKYEDRVREAFGFLASTLLDDQIVYTLKAKDYQGKMAEMLLQEIKVKEGRLEVVLGL
ncbi:MAG: hypothetical protein ACJAVK_000184 [Akkermansiaceae bacterium]|jgi:hypothetical protein